MKHFHWYFASCLLLVSSFSLAQDKDLQLINRLSKGKDQIKPEETVSFRSDYPYIKAIQDLSELSRKITGKIIVDTSPLKRDETKAIGTGIQAMYWKDALENILRQNGNWYEENPEYFMVFSLADVKKDVTPLTQGGQQGQQMGGQVTGASQLPVAIDSSKIFASQKEITVSAILLEVNQSKLRENGITFSIFRGSNVNVGFQFSGASFVGSNKAPIITANPTDPRLTVDVSAAINFFETEGYGEVVSRPVVRVRTGGSSSIVVGSSFFSTTKDFSGNTIQTQILTGTQLFVTPKIYRFNDVDFIDLSYFIDKSSPNFLVTGTTVDHNQVSGRLLMLDGERTYVSGLISTTQSTTRQGIPFLKDLPWWFFGLRYIFGYDNVNSSKRELIVIIDAKIEQSIEERTANQAKSTDKEIQERLRQLREDTDKRLKKN